MKFLTRVILSSSMVLMPALSWACPLCANASPYKDGLLVAVGFLIFVPFVATYLMYGWFRRASRTDE